MILGASINVLDYGADPTGAVDSSTAFAAAIAAGTTIFVPPGTYKLLSTIAVPSNRTIFGVQGESILTTTHVDTGSPFNVVDFYWFNIQGASITNRKSNIVFDGLSFQTSGNFTACAVKAFWADDIVVKNCKTYGAGLIFLESDTLNQYQNFNGAYNAINTAPGADKTVYLNKNIQVFNNYLYPEDPTKTTARICGITLHFSKDALVQGNTIINSFFGIWSWGGNAAGVEYTDPRYFVGAIIDGNTVRNNHAGIWWSMGIKIVCSNNFVSVSDDVCLDPEGSVDCLVEGNYAEHAQTGVGAQFRASIAVIWSNNFFYTDNGTHGYKATWEGRTLFNDSSAGLGSYAREVFFKNNTFKFDKVTGFGTYEIGEVFINLVQACKIENNTFINSKLTGVAASLYGYSAIGNTFNYYYGTGLPFSAMQIPNALSAGGESVDNPVVIKGNKIVSDESQPVGTIGIDGAFYSYTQGTTILEGNIVKGLQISLQFSAGGYGPVIIKDNIFDGLINDTSAAYTVEFDKADRARNFYVNNMKPNGTTFFTAVPQEGTFYRCDGLYPTRSGQWAGFQLISGGAAYKELWTSGHTYTIGQQVLGSDGKVYKCKTYPGAGGQDPTTDTTHAYWNLYCNTAAVFKDAFYTAP